MLTVVCLIKSKGEIKEEISNVKLLNITRANKINKVIKTEELLDLMITKSLITLVGALLVILGVRMSRNLILMS